MFVLYNYFLVFCSRCLLGQLYKYRLGGGGVQRTSSVSEAVFSLECQEFVPNHWEGVTFYLQPYSKSHWIFGRKAIVDSF